MERPHYFTVGNELAVLDAATLRERWRGMPDGARVLFAFALPGTDDAICLLDWMCRQRQQFRNLLRIGSNGAVIWRAPIVSRLQADAYLSARIQDGELRAETWSSLAVVLNPATGEVLSLHETR